MALTTSPNQTMLLPKAVAYVRPFFVGVTGLTLTVTRSKAGAAFGAAAGAVAELTVGWYKISLTAVDTDTEGALAFHATDGGTNIVDWCDQVSAPTNIKRVNDVAVTGDGAATPWGPA